MKQQTEAEEEGFCHANSDDDLGDLERAFRGRLMLRSSLAYRWFRRWRTICMPRNVPVTRKVQDTIDVF